MKTKLTIVIVAFFAMISGPIAKAQVTDTLDLNKVNYFYCSTENGTVSLCVPEWMTLWSWNGNYSEPCFEISIESQGSHFINYKDLNGYTSRHDFNVHFIDNPPSKPWNGGEVYKCPESTISIEVPTDNQQVDFEYLWSSGETTAEIEVTEAGTYHLTITGVCGEPIEDSITVIDHPSPQVNLGEDMLGLCNWDHPTLSPGEFNSYLWSDGSTESTLTITEYGVYAITVTDENSCVASDEIEISFYVNPGLEITVVTMDTVTGNNMVTWNTNIPDFQGENVKVYRNGSTNQLTEIGTASYDDGYFIDQVNSTNRTWRYAISVQDECENWSGVSLWHQSMKVSLLEAVGSGIQVSWTQYEVEGNTKDFSIASYEIYSVPGFGINWALNEVASIPGTETTYDIPASLDSLFVVGAVFASNAKSDEESVVSLSFNDNPVINTGVEMLSLSNLSIYPNPSHTGTIVVDAIGELEIYNSLGQKILAKKLKGPDQISLNSGIYMVKFLDQNNATTTKKVIIY